MISESGIFLTPVSGRLPCGLGGGLMLSISQTSGYAIVALSELVDIGDDWVLAQHISKKCEFPGPYLSKILHALGRAKLILTKRGYRGGFKLARPANKIQILEIIEAVDGPEWMGACLLGQSYCSDDRACPTHDFWKVERERIRKRLADLTLAEAAKFERSRTHRVSTSSKQTTSSDRAATKVKRGPRAQEKSNNRPKRRARS
ncbi:MAG: RrF2 family transcriptional regulator [Planctomycetota bacterium]